MNFILDANILFSCLISGKKIYIDLITGNKCFAPDFILNEINKYEERILKKKGIKVDFKEYVKEVFTHLIIIPKLAIGQETWKAAYDLCSDIDVKDTAYVALSIEFDMPLLTRDKKLFKGLKDKQFENIILFDQYLEHEERS